MPTYEYRCEACGSRFEEFQRMSDDPVEKCPQCGRPEAERMMSAGAGLVFKGSGFYETDYKRSGPGEEAAGTEDAGAEEGDGGAESGDSGAEGSGSTGGPGKHGDGESAA